MAYISQDEKRALAPGIKKVLAKYGVKGTISVRDHSVLVVTIRSGDLDFIGDANEKNKEYAERRGTTFYEVKDHYQVNPYHHDSKDPKIQEFFDELVIAMKGPNWFDESDIQTDYFHTAWYVNINVGAWDKPYVYNKELEVV